MLPVFALPVVGEEEEGEGEQGAGGSRRARLRIAE
jgi:hypothetical protein